MSTYADEYAFDPDIYAHRDHARLQRRAVFLSELESARRMIARVRDVDRTVVAREVLGRRSLARGR